MKVHTFSKGRALPRVDSGIISWLLMVLKGTLTLQSSAAAVLASFLKFFGHLISTAPS
jgi:hypothetical protein